MSKRPRVLFSHGLDSSPSSRKIVELSPIAEQLGFETEAIDYRDLRDDPAGRRDRLIARIRELETPPLLAGSSLGGWVSVSAAEQCDVAGLWLTAPALFLEDRVEGGLVPDAYAIRTDHVVIVHGWQDEVIPWQHSVCFAESCNAQLHLVDDGHRLEKSIPAMKRWFGIFLERF